MLIKTKETPQTIDQIGDVFEDLVADFPRLTELALADMSINIPRGPLRVASDLLFRPRAG